MGRPARRVIGVSRAPCGQEHFLDSLLGIPHVAEDAEGKTDRLAVMRVVERFEVGEVGNRRPRRGHD